MQTYLYVVCACSSSPYYWAESPSPVNSRTATPHMDQLRSESAIFTRAYSAGVMCAPSRFALMTGRYPSRGEKAQKMTSSTSCTNSADNPNRHRVTDVKVSHLLCFTCAPAGARFVFEHIRTHIILFPSTLQVFTTRLDTNDKVKNLPQTLKAAGYRTGVVGKWHLSVETTVSA